MVTRTKKPGAATVKRRAATKKRLYDAAEHMEDSRQKFATETLRVLGGIESFNKRLRTFEVALDKRDELITARLEFTHTVMDSLTRLMDVLNENTAALNNNTERLNGFMAKVESYFGSGDGLEREN